MKNFNQFINEKFTHNEKDIIATANGIAKAISKMDNVKAEVHDLEYDKGKGAGFEISINGEKSAGGSYIVKDDGWVINVAIANKFPNAQYARIGDIKHRNPIGKVDIDDIIRNIKLYENKKPLEIKINEKRDPESIQKEYADLKKLSKKELQTMWSRSYKVGNPKELDKEGLISDILRSKHGNKYVDAAFESIILNEAKEETGLMIKGRTRSDNQKIDDILDDLDLYAEWDAKEGYFFLPEEEDMFDELEMMIQKEFNKHNVNAYFEGFFESFTEAKKNIMKRIQPFEQFLNEATNPSTNL